MLIDTEKVDLKDLDFRPKCDDVKLDKDTSWRVYEKYYSDPKHKHDIVLYSNAGVVDGLDSHIKEARMIIQTTPIVKRARKLFRANMELRWVLNGT